MSDYIGLVSYYLVTCLSKLQVTKRYFHRSEESLKLPLSLLAYVNTILKDVLGFIASLSLNQSTDIWLPGNIYPSSLTGTTSTHARRSLLVKYCSGCAMAWRGKHKGASELVQTDYIPSGSLSRTIYPI